MATLEKDLVKQIKTGDRADIERAYDLYFNPVMNFVYFMLYDYEAARDISQEAFLRVVSAIKLKKSNVRDLKAYLFSTARNLSMDELKRAKRFTEYSTAATTLADPGIFADPARAAALAEQRGQVAHAVAALNEHQRTAMVLRDVEGWSYDEIGEFLGLSRNAVGVLLSRARLKFRREFRREQIDVDALVGECSDMFPVMSSVIDGEASEAERERLQAHLAACPVCRENFEELTGTLRSMVPLAPVLALKLVLVAKAAAVGGAGVGVAAGTAAGMSVAAKLLVGLTAAVLIGGAGAGTYIAVKKSAPPPPAPVARVMMPGQGDALTRDADDQGLALVVIEVAVDNKPQHVELSIDGNKVHTFDKGPYRYEWKTAAAGARSVTPAALGAGGKRYPGQQVAFSLAINKKTAAKIVFARGGSVWVCNPDGGGQNQLTQSGYDDMPQLSPDGTKIAFVSHRDRLPLPDRNGPHFYEYLTQLYVMDADGANLQRLTDAGTGDCYSFGFFPASDRLVFNRRTDFGGEQATWRLSTVPVSGGAVADIDSERGYPGQVNFDFPSVTTDGRYVYSASESVFEATEITNGSIVRTEVATGQTQPILAGGVSGDVRPSYYLPFISLDGVTLGCNMENKQDGERTGPVQLVLSDLAGNNRRVLQLPPANLFPGEQRSPGYAFISRNADGGMLMSGPGYISGFGNIDPYSEGDVYLLDANGAIQSTVLQNAVAARWGFMNLRFDR